MIHFEDNRYGFDYGSAVVTRIHSNHEKGWVLIGIASPKASVQVYVTKTGKMRIFNEGGAIFEDVNGEKP